ncbi:DEAD/DEAH box helicase [Vibrio metoecus]|uniref:DEAD/DEAH box helicase n=1 Tax=Vibrio metoecus TaxID=1481663 RepID=UPI000BA98870|nr:helicase-related protein [Vibrio metoecus]PAR34433.1 helicase [Vibrio metoecus]PAR44328.1 helicase [Vibrio metoecus]
MSAQLQVGEWAWSQAHQQHVKVIESSALWGQSFYRVWLQQQDSVVKVPAKDLSQATNILTPSAHYITYIGIAAKIANAQREDILLAPVESNVIPLPHQLKALDKAMSRRQVRYLFADEVGLGKTIEAGLVMRELKLRGMAKRILVCAPKGLVSQWVSEMQTHFNETFHLLLPGEQKPLDENDNVWLKHDLVVCPVDSIKPIENRKGWSIKQVHEYNKHRFDDLLAAGWDLIVIDEAHRLGGSTELVARYKLGQGLAEASPYLLLLSATPHQGKSDAFHRLMALLDKEAFPDVGSVTKERVQPYVVRTEKRISIDGQGQPLFKPRKTELVPVAWGSKHALQRHLYQEVTEYVKEGYNRAKAKKQNAIGFLMILMQRLVSSSSAAIAMTLSRRLQSLENTVVEDELPLAFADDWAELDGQAQLDELIASTKQALENEKADVQRLLNIANDCVSKESDTKAEALIDWLYKLQQEEQDPNLKMLVFTEFVPTQQMLSKFFRDRGISVVTLNGSMDLSERKKAQADFEHTARILISTDAGGEGLNLQFCHVIVNYDIPWNPMRMEQRIGRVDRIGQKHTVRALNFVLEDSVEYRVRDVLESKLQIILDEFGVDKTSDVLDSAEANHLFDELFMESISNPETMDQELAKALQIIQSGAQDKKAQDGLFSDGTPLNASDYQQLINHPLPFWVQKMVESYLVDKFSQGVDAKFIRSADGTITITWPDGAEWDNVTFSGKEAQQNSVLTHVTLENPKVRGLSTHLPIWNEQQSIPTIHIPSLPSGATGFWSLWSVRFSGQDERQMQYFPMYINSAGQYFSTASNRIWDAICTDEVQVVENDAEAFGVDSLAYVSLRETAEKQGKSVFEAMCSAFLDELEQRIEKGEYSFAARRNAIERIGLPEVRNYRLRQLDSEYRHWQLELEQKRDIYPELNLHLALEIKN